MNMENIPTPETGNLNLRVPVGTVWLSHARDLERRLIVAREALQDIKNRASDATIMLHPDADAKGCADDVLEWSEQALAQTAPKP